MEPDLKERVAKALKASRALDPGRSSDEESPQEQEAELLVQDGMIFLDGAADGRRQVLTNVIIGERAVLPGHTHTRWEMHYEDGFGVCLPADGVSDPVLVEDITNQQVFSAGNTALIVVDRRCPNSFVDLRHLASKNVEMALRIVVGTARVEVEYKCSKVSMARRPNGKIFVSLKSCYENMGLTQFSGQSWRWIFSGWENWKGFLGTFGLGPHLVPSVQSKVAHGLLGGLVESQRK